MNSLRRRFQQLSLQFVPPLLISFELISPLIMAHTLLADIYTVFVGLQIFEALKKLASK